MYQLAVDFLGVNLIIVSKGQNEYENKRSEIRSSGSMVTTVLPSKICIHMSHVSQLNKRLPPITYGLYLSNGAKQPSMKEVC